MAKKKRNNGMKEVQYKSPFSSVWSFVMWVVGVLVSLAVGFGMIGKSGVPVLAIPYIPSIVTVTAGWIVVVLTVLGVLLKLIDKIGN